MGSVYSPSLAEATVYGYTFLLATPNKDVQRVKAGMARARIEGKHVGRPRLDDRTRRQVREFRAQNPDMSIRAIARETEVPYATTRRLLLERGLGLACVFVPLFLEPRPVRGYVE